MGRLPIDINVEEVEFLRSLNLHWNRITQILGISRHTLYCRLKNEGILQDLQFTDISDSDLNDVLTQIKAEHPNDGKVLVRVTSLRKAFVSHVNVYVPQFIEWIL